MVVVFFRWINDIYIYIYIYIAISDSKNERPYWGCSWCQIIVKTQLTSTKIIHADDNKY